VKIETLRTLFSHADQNPTGLNIATQQVNLCRSTCAAQPEPKRRVARLNGLNGVKIKAAKQMDLKNGSMELQRKENIAERKWRKAKNVLSVESR